MNVFQKIEQFVEKYDVEIINNRLVFPNNEDTLKYCIEDFLEIKLFIRNDIDNPRKVAMDIDVKLVDKKLDKLFHSEWSNRERLDSFVLRNKEKLLRNIKISIEELPPFYRKLIESYYSKKEKPKVLQK